MSLGGLTSMELAVRHPALVRRLVLVDITPGVNQQKAKAVLDFVDGPQEFASFDDLLERTMSFNPTRSESSMRRGILHNAAQHPDGSWQWRYDRSSHARSRDARRRERRAGNRNGSSGSESGSDSAFGFDDGRGDVADVGRLRSRWRCRSPSCAVRPRRSSTTMTWPKHAGGSPRSTCGSSTVPATACRATARSNWPSSWRVLA